MTTDSKPRISFDVHAFLRAGATEQARRLRKAYRDHATLTDHQIKEAERALGQSQQYVHHADITRELADQVRSDRLGTLSSMPVADNRAAAKPTVQVDKLMAAFEKAQSDGLKKPVLRFEHFQASLAPVTGRNPGAVYVKVGSDYMGKIVQGKFATQPGCTSEIVAAVQAAMEDPLAAAVAFGKRTGQCSCCGRELTDPESIARGIGPICAEHFGL